MAEILLATPMPSQCSVPDCGAPASAHGLCAKHYMRARRHGDPGVTHKRGPKPDPSSNAEMIEELSPRTRARFDRAMRLDHWLRELGDEGYIEQAITAATRPNGSLNFAKVLAIMEMRAAFLTDALEIGHE